METVPERDSVRGLEHPSLTLGYKGLLLCSQPLSPPLPLIFKSTSFGLSSLMIIPSVHMPWESSTSLLSYSTLCAWEEADGEGEGIARLRRDLGNVWVCEWVTWDGCIYLLVIISGHLAADLVEQECHLGS